MPMTKDEKRTLMEQVAYDLYRVEWAARHLDENRVKNEILEYHESVALGEFEGSFEDYVEENGFGGELWACKNEFLECEYQRRNWLRGRVASNKTLSAMADEVDLGHDGNEHPRRHHTPVPCTVTLQVWQNDYAIHVKDVSLDGELALDGFPYDELPKHADDLHNHGVLNFGDDIYHEAVRIGLTEPWDGPFEFYIDDDDAYQEYRKERKRDEPR